MSDRPDAVLFQSYFYLPLTAIVKNYINRGETRIRFDGKPRIAGNRFAFSVIFNPHRHPLVKMLVEKLEKTAEIKN